MAYGEPYMSVFSRLAVAVGVAVKEAVNASIGPRDG